MAPSAGMRPKSKTPRGVLQVDWPFFGELCRVLALKVFREYDPQVVIGIAKAGVIPGSVIAGPQRLVTGKRVLLVDETCESGSTMKLALAAVREQKPAEVKTAVSFKTGTYKPDFYALENENFIILPWDLEVIVNGEIVVRPDYRAQLKDSR